MNESLTAARAVHTTGYMHVIGPMPVVHAFVQEEINPVRPPLGPTLVIVPGIEHPVLAEWLPDRSIWRAMTPAPQTAPGGRGRARQPQALSFSRLAAGGGLVGALVPNYWLRRVDVDGSQVVVPSPQAGSVVTMLGSALTPIQYTPNGRQQRLAKYWRVSGAQGGNAVLTQVSPIPADGALGVGRSTVVPATSLDVVPPELARAILAGPSSGVHGFYFVDPTYVPTREQAAHPIKPTGWAFSDSGEWLLVFGDPSGSQFAAPVAAVAKKPMAGTTPAIAGHPSYPVGTMVLLRGNSSTTFLVEDASYSARESAWKYSLRATFGSGRPGLVPESDIRLN